MIALLVLVPATARAQASFQPGYVVQPGGDTLRGAVDYRGGALSARRCRYRPAPDGSITEYGPGELRGYGFVGGRRFQARLVVPIDSAAPPAAQPVFLEVLTAGALILYRLRTDVDRYFIRPASQPVTQPVAELIARRPAPADHATRAYRQAPLYRSLLSGLVSKCPVVRMSVGSLPFKASALTDLVQQYNGCAGSAPAPAPPARPTERARARLLVGGEASQLVFEDIFLAEGRYRSPVHPVCGLSLEVPLASLSECLSLRLEGLLEQQRYADAFRASTAFARVNLELTYLRLPLLLRYTLPNGRLRPFVQAGVSYARVLRSATAVELGRGNGAGSIAYGPPQPLTVFARAAPHEIGFVGSVGAHMPPVAGRTLTVELRAERSSGPIEESGFGSLNRRFFALLAYSLTK